MTDRLYWGALALFGVAALAQGVSRATADPDVGAWVTILGGVVVLGASVAAVVRDEELSGGADSTLVRAAAVGGALLYATVTFVGLL